MNTKKNIIIWSLYDFANSFVFITFLIYFSKWLVVNNGFPDFWYNATFIIGSIGLVFLAPWLGSKAVKFIAVENISLYPPLAVSCFTRSR